MNTDSDDAPLAVITGAVDGIGAALAELLAQRGWRLVLLNRSVDRTRPLRERMLALTPGLHCEVIETDLSDHTSIASSASMVKTQYRRVDALFNNAGVLHKDLVQSRHGNEMHFEVNTVAPYLLTIALMPVLSAAAEQRGRSVVVTASSAVVKSAKRFLPDKLRTGVRGGVFGAYAQSKLAWAVLNTHLARQSETGNIEFYAIDPGTTRSRMTKAGGGAPLPVRLMSRWLPAPSRGAERLAAVLESDWSQPSGSMLVNGKRIDIPAGAADGESMSRLISILKDATK
ncbi:MAG: SDR family NAD(P)-dependent oxidoreductase [Planctomycetota bacterium]